MEIAAPDRSEVKLALTDITGRRVAGKSYMLDKGMNVIGWNDLDLKAGIYFLSVASGNHIVTQKVIKQ